MKSVRQRIPSRRNRVSAAQDACRLITETVRNSVNKRFKFITYPVFISESKCVGIRFRKRIFGSLRQLRAVFGVSSKSKISAFSIIRSAVDRFRKIQLYLSGVSSAGSSCTAVCRICTILPILAVDVYRPQPSGLHASNVCLFPCTGYKYHSPA